MALEGTLRDFAISDIFQLVSLQQKTGHLRLSNKDETVTVSFCDGKVVGADSSQGRIEDRLGTVLVRGGHVTEEQLQEALNQQKKTLARLGHILVDSKNIEPDTLKNALKVQVTQIIYRLFRWKDGEYQFTPETKVEYDKDYFSPVSSESILMEGMRIIDEWPIVEKKIRSKQAVYRKVAVSEVVEEEDEAVASPLADDDFKFDLGDGTSDIKEEAKIEDGPPRIKLSREESKVYKLVDGERTVEEIIYRSGMNEFDVAKSLYELLSRNLIEEVVVEQTGEVKVSAPSKALGSLTIIITGAILALLALTSIWKFQNLSWNIPGLFKNSSEIKRIEIAQSKARLLRLRNAVMAYYAIYEQFPPSLEDVVNTGVLTGEQILDPNGRSYLYEITGEEGFKLQGIDNEGGLSPELLYVYSTSLFEKETEPETETEEQAE